MTISITLVLSIVVLILRVAREGIVLRDDGGNIRYGGECLAVYRIRI
jgi:hypothetical protein